MTEKEMLQRVLQDMMVLKKIILDHINGSKAPEADKEIMSLEECAEYTAEEKHPVPVNLPKEDPSFQAKWSPDFLSPRRHLEVAPVQPDRDGGRDRAVGCSAPGEPPKTRTAECLMWGRRKEGL